MSDEAMQQLGREIKAARARKGWNQADAAAALGMSSYRLGRIERAEVPMTVPELFTLATVFGLNPSSLLQVRSSPAQ